MNAIVKYLFEQLIAILEKMAESTENKIDDAVVAELREVFNRLNTK
jgi:hypothetical protein